MDYPGDGGGHGPHRRRYILLVEDDLDNADAMRAVLESWGFWVDVAHDGEGAFARAQSKLPDGIVLDLGLPTFADGCVLVKRLRALPGGDAVLVVAITGYGRESDRCDAIGAGCDFFFVKPPDLDEVHSAIMAIGARRAWAGQC
jgi:DNA-binding response OmpR family regulator